MKADKLGRIQQPESSEDEMRKAAFYQSEDTHNALFRRWHYSTAEDTSSLRLRAAPSIP